MAGHRLTLLTFITILPLAVATPAPAQTAEDVLSRIPADSMAFCGAADTAAAFANLGRFAGDVTMGAVPPNVLDMIKMNLQLGEGFRDDGGFAIVLLNPAPFGLDYAAMVRGEQPPPEEDPPFAILLPGSPAMFDAWMPQTDSGYTVINFGAEPAYAKALGGFTVLAPRREFVDAVVNADSSVATTAPKDHLAMLKRGDFFAYADGARLAPVVSAAVDQATKMMTEGPLPDEDMRSFFKVYAQLLKFYDTFFFARLQAGSAALAFADDGVLVDSLVTVKDDTPLATVLKGTRRADAPLFARLPATTYILALGGAWQPLTGEALAAQDRLGAELNRALFSGADPELLEEATRTTRRFNAHLRGIQYTYTAPPTGQGVLAVAGTMVVDDASAVMAQMPDYMKTQMALSRRLFEGGRLEDMLEMTYAEDVATVAGASVDALDFAGVYSTMSADEQQQVREMMTKVYGQEDLRVYIARASDDAIVFSFGGGTDFLARAVAAARGEASLAGDAAIAQGIAKLPLAPMMAGVFSPTNTLEAAKKAVATLAPPDEAEEVLSVVNLITLQSTTPVAYGLATEGAGVRQAVFVPKAFVTDLIQNAQMVFMHLMTRQQQQPQAPPPQWENGGNN